jgi:hypothetical protein
MTSAEIWEQIKTLTAEERLELREKLFERYPTNIPASLRKSMAEDVRGDLIDLSEAHQDLSKSSDHRLV